MTVFAAQRDSCLLDGLLRVSQRWLQYVNRSVELVELDRNSLSVHTPTTSVTHPTYAMFSPALSSHPPHEVKLHEKRNERVAEDRHMERLKMKLKVLRQRETAASKIDRIEVHRGLLNKV